MAHGSKAYCDKNYNSFEHPPYKATKRSGLHRLMQSAPHCVRRTGVEPDMPCN